MTSRNFVFTQNNYSDASEQYIQGIREVKFLGYAHEIGLSGTKHLQGVICFETPVRITHVIKLLPKSHIERMKGSFVQAWDKYIVANPDKPVDPDLYSYGEPPAARGANLSERYDHAWECATSGQLDAIPKDLMLRYYGTLNKISHDYATVSDATDVTGTWIVGPPGCGKSRYVRDHYPDAYDKRANQWWDGYRQGYHTAVVVDDLDTSHAYLSYHLNRWADRYAFNAEVKGGMTKIRPTRVIVTSRYTIDEVFATADSSTRESLRRRFPEVITLGATPPLFNSHTTTQDEAI